MKAATPHLFDEVREINYQNYIIVPVVSSENRSYLPVGFLGKEIIPYASAQFIPNGTIYDFGIINSEMHNDWMRTVAGRLESRYRYSATLVYNTFPWPDVSDEKKSHIESLAEEILPIREDYPTMTMAQKYNPDTMPTPLLEAHQALDKAVEKLYRDKAFVVESNL